ncbi:DUF5713 family protein [Streptomyces sp. NPDC051098]|uniref:DUF5713 family protein n=1 Tax=Streptomyces sp. NPDC051098 TaxID=3155411 RepID=UPI00344810AD
MSEAISSTTPQETSEFVAAGSGIETVARECICDEFRFVASAYGFTEADAEELTAGRDW